MDTGPPYNAALVPLCGKVDPSRGRREPVGMRNVSCLDVRRGFSGVKLGVSLKLTGCFISELSFIRLLHLSREAGVSSVL